jgi:hypothetical protein
VKARVLQNFLSKHFEQILISTHVLSVISASSMELHETAWNCMKQHEKHDLNIFMLQGAAWNCMELHGTA